MRFPNIFVEDHSESYQAWEAIVLGLFQQFKFNYENLGKSLVPEKDGDVSACEIWDKLSQSVYFGEKGRVHFNRYFAYGGDVTGYPMADNTIAWHHFTVETYAYFWPFPALDFLNKEEVLPFIFSTDENFFMEGCNGTFIEDDKYLMPQSYPIYHPEHKKFFTEEFFLKNGLNPLLLTEGYDLSCYGIDVNKTTLSTLHFALRIFWMSVLFLGVIEMLFGQNKNNEAKIDYLESFWKPNYGVYSSKIDPYKMNVLSFLYLSFHPVSTLLCYGLYRDKYGINQGERTTIYVKRDDKAYAFKDFLKEQICEYIDLVNSNSDKIKNRTQCSNLINSVLAMAAMFGVGYKTKSIKRENIHINSPVDFRPKDLSESLEGINFTVSHDPQSPLWRLFYEYCGDWWSYEEIVQVIVAEGEHWARLKKVPRSFFINYCHVYAARFWAEQADALITKVELKNRIKRQAMAILLKNGIINNT